MIFNSSAIFGVYHFFLGNWTKEVGCIFIFEYMTAEKTFQQIQYSSTKTGVWI